MPSKTSTGSTGAIVSEDAIRDRAYYLWEADGRPEGNGEHYWNIAAHEATEALVKTSSEALARTARGKNPHEDMPGVKAPKVAKPKLKVAAAEVKAPKKTLPKPRAAPVAKVK